MFSLLLVLTVLLAAENAFYEFVLKDRSFLLLSGKESNAILYSAITGIVTFASAAVSWYLFSSTDMLVILMVASVFSAIFVGYDFFVRKSSTKLHSIAVFINAASAVLLASTGEEFSLLNSLMNGLDVFICSACFCGIKDSLVRFNCSMIKSVLYALSLLALAVLAFYGFNF